MAQANARAKCLTQLLAHQHPGPGEEGPCDRFARGSGIQVLAPHPFGP
jgi:hypothetical protein